MFFGTSYPLQSSYVAPQTTPRGDFGVSYPATSPFSTAPALLPSWSSSPLPLPTSYTYGAAPAVLGSSPYSSPAVLPTWPAASFAPSYGLPSASPFTFSPTFPTITMVDAPITTTSTTTTTLGLPPPAVSLPLSTASPFGNLSLGTTIFGSSAFSLPGVSYPFPYSYSTPLVSFPSVVPAPTQDLPPVEKKLIVVLGATGAQGGGLVRAILGDPAGPFKVRAITRDVNSAKAKELALLGAEVVAASIDDKESILAALQGAYGAFFVTFFWDHFSAEKETTHARTLAEAAKEAHVEHVIWSTLEDTRMWIPLTDTRMPTLQGKYKVPHLDSKAEGDRFFRELQVPTTFLVTSFYWDNLIHFGMAPKKGPDGRLVFSIPLADKKMPGIAAEDIGRCAYGILKGGRDFVGRTIGIAGEHLSGQEMAQALSVALGQEVAYYAMPHDDYRKLGFPGADDLGNMFQFFTDCDVSVRSLRDVERSRLLNPALQSFGEWLVRNKDRIPLE